MTTVTELRLDTPWLLRRVNQRFRNAIRQELAASGHDDLPQQGVWALSAVAAGAAEATVLVAEMGVTKQSVSKLVETLVRSGYLARHPHEQDRRRMTLALTVRGRRAAAAIDAAVASIEDEMIAEVGQRNFEAARTTLIRLAMAADELR